MLNRITVILLITGIILTANEVNGSLVNRVIKLDNILSNYWRVRDLNLATVDGIQQGWCKYLYPKSMKILAMVKRIFKGNKAVIILTRRAEQAKLNYLRELCNDPIYMEFAAEQNQVLSSNLEPLLMVTKMMTNSYLIGAQNDSDMNLSQLFCLERKFIKIFISLMPTPTLRWYFKHIFTISFEKYKHRFHRYMYALGGDPHEEQCDHLIMSPNDDVFDPGFNPLKIQSPDLAFLLALDRIIVKPWIIN